MISAFLSASLLAQETTPVVVPNTFLESTAYFLDGAEPRLAYRQIQFAFPPSDQFVTKMVVKEGSTVVSEMGTTSGINRGGAFASVGPKSAGAFSLGTSNGPRTIEIFLNDKLAGSFTFNLTKQTNGDPLDPKTTWKIDGPWKNHAYIKNDLAATGRSDIFFVYWAALHELPSGQKTCSATLKQGTKVIATSRDNYPAGTPYSRFEVPFQKPDKNFLGTIDVTTMKGDYSIEVKSGSKVLRNFKFTVTNGAINAHPLSDMKEANKITWLSPRILNGNTVSKFTHYWLTSK